MNDSKNSSIGLLVLRYPCDLSQETANKLTEYLTPTAEALGVEPLVIGNGGDVKIIESGYDTLLTRLCVAVEALVAQGEPPSVSEEMAPPALNARPTGLNSRG